MTLKLTSEQREILRLRQSLMTIGTWARCFDDRHETAEKAMQDIVKETERALGVQKKWTKNEQQQFCEKLRTESKQASLMATMYP